MTSVFKGLWVSLCWRASRFRRLMEVIHKYRRAIDVSERLINEMDQEEQDLRKDLGDARLEIERLEQKCLSLETERDRLKGTVDVLEKHRELLADVVNREQQRVQAETAMYIRLNTDGAPVPPAGRIVSRLVNPEIDE